MRSVVGKVIEGVLPFTDPWVGILADISALNEFRAKMYVVKRTLIPWFVKI